MRHRRTQTDFLRFSRLLLLFAWTFLPSFAARASDLEIVPREVPYVRRETILSLKKNMKKDTELYLKMLKKKLYLKKKAKLNGNVVTVDTL